MLSVSAGDGDSGSIAVAAGEADCCVGDNAAGLASGVTAQNIELCDAMGDCCQLETKRLTG